ncbi:T9SS_type A sorting domain-containing protein [Hexamita inflata]|uniref:T9SS type A sorting domain-containing protein n=1 Tax=Hexamita inflata TaxID=28002 RepID=A0AA86Q7A5_9EUKA|nr:T9SS type A sorting domain-containing protein [Hexamita inflata]
MSAQNQNVQNQEYETKMTHKYEGKINNGNLEIGDVYNGDPEITSLSFIEQFNIVTLILNINDNMDVKLSSRTIKSLTLQRPYYQYQLNLNIDDLEFENLEELQLQNNASEKTYQQFNQSSKITKFKKLHTLNISLQTLNSVDLKHICSIRSLVTLYVVQCGLRSIDCIGSLINLEVLDISLNEVLKINQMRLLVNLKELNISNNDRINITPLKYLVGLIKLDLSSCAIKKLNVLKSLVNLQYLNAQYNYSVDISALQYLKKLTFLNLTGCDLISIFYLSPLVNLESLKISNNHLVCLDANLNNMNKLTHFEAFENRISDFTSISNHQYFNKFLLYNKDKPTKTQLRFAKKVGKLQDSNILLIELQNKQKSSYTTLNNLKWKINQLINLIHANQIQFTSTAVNLFHLSVFE